MAGGASGAAGWRAGGGLDGGAGQGGAAVIVPCDLSVTGPAPAAHTMQADRQNILPALTTLTFTAAAQKPPAPGRPAGRQAVSQPPPVVCTARASVRSAGGRPPPAQKPPPPRTAASICEAQKQGKDVLGLG